MLFSFSSTSASVEVTVVGRVAAILGCAVRLCLFFKLFEVARVVFVLFIECIIILPSVRVLSIGNSVERRKNTAIHKINTKIKIDIDFRLRKFFTIFAFHLGACQTGPQNPVS